MFGATIPTRMVSNGQYFPHKQTKKQQRIEARVKELAVQASRKLGITRKQFLASPGGLAASFVAMNEVFGPYFDVRPVEMFEPSAFTAYGLPRDVFVFDSQLHVVAGSVSSARNLRVLARDASGDAAANGNGAHSERPWAAWNPTLIGAPLRCDTYHIVQFVKDVFLDGGVAVGVLDSVVAPTADGDSRSAATNPPTNGHRNELRRVRQAADVRDFVNGAAGSQRLFAHGLLDGSADAEFVEHQIAELTPDSWKAYAADADAKNGSRRWRMDDERVAYPAYEAIARRLPELAPAHPGMKNICVHTGLDPDDDVSDARGHAAHIPRAARDWPQLNFLIYHSCLRPAFFLMEAIDEAKPSRLRNGVPDVRGTTEFVDVARDLPNVYAEIGTTWASTVTTFPAVAAHILGQLMTGVGPQRILFGSDSVWYGSPLWQIEALWRFQIPEPLQCQFGYPALTPSMKRDILGLNAARLYGVRTECVCRADDMFSRGREEYVVRGAETTNARYGWIRM